MSSLQASQEGETSLERQALQMMPTLGIKPGPDGKYSVAHFAAAMKFMGLSQEQIVAYAASRSSKTDSRVVAGKLKANNAQEMEQLYSVIDQESLSNSFLGRSVRNVRTGLKRSIDFAAENYTAPVVAGAAWWGDKLENVRNDLLRGSTLRRSGIRLFSEVEGEVSRVTGQGGMSDSLSVMREAHDLRAYYAAHPEENMEKTISQKIQEKGFENLRASVSGLGPIQASNQIRTMTSYALSSGLMRAAMVSEKGMSLDEIAKRAGGSLMNLSVTPPSDMTDKQYSALTSPMAAAAKISAMTAGDSGSQFDWSQFSQVSNSLDASASNLNTAAVNLNEAASTIRGIGDGTSSGPKKEWSNWGKLFGFGQGTQNSIGK